jgi:methionyl-tRNA synthetase
MGYYSAPQEWAALRGEPERWREWWQDPDAESYYFIGKDNIPFHAVYWPALLMGHGGLNLPTDVPANQYVLFGGQKASKSMGVGRPLEWYLDHFEVDALRYAIAVNFPENSDTELYDDELVRRVNEELVATWGNLVNRVFSMVWRYFDGVVPEPGDRDDIDGALLGSIAAALEEVGTSIEAVRLRAGLQRAMAGAQEVNAYLSERAPWKTAVDDPRRTATTLWVALNAIGGLAVALHPYLPFTSTRVLAALGAGDEIVWRLPVVAAGRVIGDLAPLYSKMEPLEEDD